MSDGNTNNTVFIQKLFTSRDNFVDGNVQQATANAANFVGQEGRIWWNPDLNAFYYSDGNTPGGFLINGPVGNGQPGGPANSVQINNGDGNFFGSANFTFDGSNVNVAGNVNASYFIGNGSQLTDINTTKIFNDTSYANIENPNGNLEISINSNSWVFDGTGNLTLPGNGEISINYANGYPYGFSNIAAGNTSEIQFNTNDNFAASANFRFDTGSNRLYTDSVAIPVGTLLSGGEPIVYVIATLTLNQILANSDGTLASLPGGSYGNPNEVPAPWAVFQFTTTPSPILEVNDILSGAGVPTPSPVVYVGTGGNSNVVVTSSTFYGLPTPIPTNPTQIPVARQTVNAGLQIATQTDTDIVMTPGVGGGIIWAGNLIPLTTNEFTIGSPTRRIKQAYYGGGTIYIFDEYLGIDQSIGANNGNLLIGGGTGLTVGNFILSGNTLYLVNPTEDFNIGTPGATGNLNINRPITVSDSAGNITFSVTSDGRTQIDTGYVPGNNPGAMLINGSIAGTYPNVANPGGMLHIVGNESNASRITLDAVGPFAGAGAYSIITSRIARGSYTSPTATQAGDTFLRLSGVGYGTTGYPIGGTTIELAASQNFTDSNAGSQINFYTTPLGNTGLTGKTLSAFITPKGLTLPNTSTNGTGAGSYNGNGGITFADDSYQNTAFNDTSAVTSVTVGVGLSQTTTVGDVGIDATGVTTVAGTANQVYVNANTSGGNSNAAITLTLPQNIDSGATLTFSNLTITGTLTAANFTSAGNSIIHDKILNLAYDSTSNAQIDGGGIILGNVNDPYAVSILYDLNNNQWTTDGAGLYTLDLTAANANIDFLNVQNGGHFGLINEQLDYPNAYIQVDSNVNSYSQIVSQNHSPGTQASSDLVLVNDIGDDDNHFLDLGINGSNYVDPAFSSTLANDGYLFVNQGNLVIGTDTPGQVVNFVAGGTTSNDIILSISNTGLVTPGNVQANYFIGNGSRLTGLPAGNIVGQVANALVAGTVYTNAQPNITSVGTLTELVVSGNITSGNANLGNVATANFFVGNGYGLTNINVANIVGTIANANYAAYAGNVTLAAQSNITSLGTLTGLIVSGNITSGNANLGNLASANYFSGNANALFNIQGANVTGQVSFAATANAVAGANVSGQVSFAATANAVAGANVSGQVGNALIAGTVYTNAQPNITSVGTLTGLTSNGIVNFTNTSNTALGAVGNVHITGGTNGQVLTTNGSGNLSWTTISTLSSISNGNSNVNIPAANGNVNISAVGNANIVVITGTGANINGYFTVTGNITSGNANLGNAVIANYFIGSGANLTNINGANITGTAANANYAAYAGNVTIAGQSNITSLGTLTGLTSNGVVNLANASNVNIGSVANMHIAGGSANYILQTNGSGTLSWVVNPGIGAITTITPNALSSTVHIAANVVGNTANIITDATTANTANTIVVRDANGAINVNGWTVGTHLTAVNYTATNSDYWIGTTTKSKTITLPNAANGAVNGRQYQIADTVHTGNPGTTIAAQSPATVVGNQPSQQGQIIIATYIGAVWYLN